MSRRTGFTLIELLVVIAIIAILAAILFPVFAKAREKARQSSCLSNVRQMSTAFMSYVQDFDERMPATVMWDPAWNGVSWPAVLSPYIKNTQLFRCPSGPSVQSTAATVPTADGWWTGWGTNYQIHYLMNTNVAQKNLAQLTVPAETALVSDGNWADGDGAAGLTSRVGQSLRHNQGVNAAFCDGHTKWVAGTNLSTLRWAP